MKKLLFIIAFITLNTFAQDNTTFSKVALDEMFISHDGERVQFKDILAKHKGKTIFIDIWASWCSDCVGSIPKLKELQKNEKEVVYVMLSLDKTIDLWKKGIQKHQLNADHYLFTKRWKKSNFCSSIGLDWIPRYLIVGKDGSIKMYKAIEFNDKKIKETINKEKSINTFGFNK